MDQFISLDVSLKDAFISVRGVRQRIWRGGLTSARLGLVLS